jgi:hypothetical protein
MVVIYQLLVILFCVCILAVCIFSVICAYYTLCGNKKKYDINNDVITNRISTRNEPINNLNELSTEIVEV